MEEVKIISQSELVKMLNGSKSKQYISQIAIKRESPLDIQVIDKRTYIRLTQRTLNWIKNNK